MPRAKFTITIPDETWISQVSKAHPDCVFKVITVLSGVDSSVALLELSAKNPVPMIADIERDEDIASLELLWKDEDEALLQVETTNPVLLDPVWEVGVPLQTPFEVVEGSASWELTTSTSRLSALGTRLEESGIQFDIDYVRSIGDNESDSILTDRQQQVLLAAVEQGYYETPRRATLTNVAESMDITKATASDILHRAEGRIVDWFVESMLQ
ncbi:helix-turn-helix domain-containing protein [Haladaptatus sp. NG-SE-30]